MKVLDLFSGLGGWSQAFKDRGHEVITIDIEEKFKPTITTDIMKLTKHDLDNLNIKDIDVVLASPPCECFSVMAISKHFSKDGVPTEKTLRALMLVEHTQQLIQELKPKLWFIENPRGMLRKYIGKPTTTISQCQYGNPYMKPTDIWNNMDWHGKFCHYRAPCHPRTPRGSNTSGIQKLKTRELRSKLPYGLSLAVCEACEKELGVKP